MANDPLTLVPAMIAAIEPGFRLIDGLLLRDLYLQAGDAATAATIEAGYRMVDTTLLRNLATMITATQTAQAFTNQMPGPRLIDGTPWRALGYMVTGQIAPLVAPISAAVPRDGVEPPTHRASSDRSTTELPRPPEDISHAGDSEPRVPRHRHGFFPHRDGDDG